MGSKPRNPRYWPRMKVRGGKRRLRQFTRHMRRVSDAARAASDSMSGLAAAYATFNRELDRTVASNDGH